MNRRRRWSRSVLRLALALVVGLGGYVGYVAVRAAQPVTLPAPTGPHPVGRTIVEWTDGTRIDPLAPQPGTPRELSVWLWYPGAAGPDALQAPYTPDAWAGLHFSGPAGLGETDFADVHAFADVPVAAGRFPVVVLEPGMGLSAPQFTTLAENLASHGYVVAGVTPTYSANLTVLDGRAVPATEAGNPQVFDAPDEHTRAVADQLVDVWAADARFAATQVAALDDGGRFAGHVDAGAVLYAGHSFGGAAALEACRTDQRCVGAADLDGTQFGAVVHTGLTRPVLLVGSENSCITGTCLPAGPEDQAALDTARTLVAASTGGVWCYQIAGAEHFDFTDYGTYYLAAPIRSLIPLGSVEGGDALSTAGTYLTTFADRVMRRSAPPGKPG